MSARQKHGNGPFTLQTEMVGALPIVNHFCDRAGVDRLLRAFVPHDDRRLRLAPAASLGIVVRNLLVSHEPVYALGEWAAPFDPTLLGLEAEEVALLNDDRVGRTLTRLFDADRASLLNRLMLDVIEHFGIDCSQLHNDSTSVRFSGVYPQATGRPRSGKTTPAIVRGHSKDHRPDLKQLVYILTISADGAVPISHRAAPGNTEDSTTHIETWNDLVALLGRSDFLYVADCKLATRDNMNHITKNGGRFVTILPASRAEDGDFRRWLVDHEPDWTEAMRRSPPRLGAPEEIWWITEAPWPSAEGYRIVWVRSSSKIERDATSRRERIARGIAALDELNQRLASPKTRLKKLAAVEAAATAALAAAGATRWVSFSVQETTDVDYRQERRGRPGRDTRYRRITRTHHRVRFSVREDVVAADACSDGCFPLITAERDLTGAEMLAAYKYQPNLERRNHVFKGDQLVAPVFLRDPARIEALLCCHFIALLIGALIEREIRTAMAARGLTEISLYPEDRACPAPSATRVIEIFAGLARHHLLDEHERVVQIFPPELTNLQRLVLELLGVPENPYS